MMYPQLPLIRNRQTNNADFEAEQEEKIVREGSLHNLKSSQKQVKDHFTMAGIPCGLLTSR